MRPRWFGVCFVLFGGRAYTWLLSMVAAKQANPYRKVLEDDGKGRQLVETESLATWRFLMFKGARQLVPWMLAQRKWHAATVNGQYLSGSCSMQASVCHTLDEPHGMTSGPCDVITTGRHPALPLSVLRSPEMHLSLMCTCASRHVHDAPVRVAGREGGHAVLQARQARPDESLRGELS